MRRKIAATVALLVILLAGGWLRVDFLRSVEHEMSPDSINYDAMTRQLLEDGVYAYADTEPNAKITPGYPLFMAAVYKLADYRLHDPLPWIRYIQVLLSVASLWLIYRIGKELSNDAAGLAAAFAAAVYPPFVWANGAVLTEVLGIFLMLGHVFAQIRTFRSPGGPLAFVSGLLLGLTVLVRPEFLPLLLVNYGFYWLWKRDMKRTLKLFACSAAGLALVLMPWWVRNVVTLNEWVVTATQANPFKAGTYPYKNYDDGLVDPEGKTEMEVAVERLKKGFSTQPWLYIEWYTIGKLDYIYSSAYFGGGHQPYDNILPPAIKPNVFHRWLVYLGLAAALALLWRWKQAATLLIAVVAAMTMIRLAFVPEYRYNVMSMPLIIIVVGVAAIGLAKWAYGLLRKTKGDNDAAFPV
ncbi:glycosyltransferase family 39 protein [Paenibacillus sp. MBLB4367]|uniref:glycosyltransferase family 39 protein n=1 Tax=Paenibacillus sp. MBLB4367 TaxID=3384767 RepID=UPI0039081D13